MFLEKQDLIFIGLIGLLFFWMTTAKFLPGEFVMLFVFVLVLGPLVGQWVWLRKRTHPYRHLRMLLRPSGKVVHLFIQNPISKHIRENLYRTTLPLAYWISFPIHGKVKTLDLQHEQTFDEKFHFGPGVAWYSGFPIEHNRSCQATIYELPNEKPGTPLYFVAEAPGDFAQKIKEPA